MNTPQASPVAAPAPVALTGPTAQLVLRSFFALLLVVTGMAKLLNMPGFYPVIDSYLVLPGALVPAAAWGLAIGELLLAAWLVSGVRLQHAAGAVVILHTLFMAWLLVALARGLELSNCGCFGAYFARPLKWFTPLEDATLVAIALWFWVTCARRAD
jgi:uncharacterized membrane protein YphA (DoxX/SURF4 family)